MKNTIIKTWPLFFGIAMMMVANGLQGTLIGIRATIEDFSVITTGFMMSAYYVGFLIGSYKIPSMIASVGHIRVFAGLASLASTTILIQGIYVEPLTWSIFRALSGFSYAGLFLVVESWLNDASTNESRGKILGMYMVVTYLGMAAGQGLLNIASPSDVELFIVISLFVSLALLPIALVKRPVPDFSVGETVRLSTIWRRSPLGVFGVMIAGVTGAIIYAIGPVFAMELGLSNAAISAFMAAFMIGCVLCQMPVAILSDKMDRRKMIIILSSLSAIISTGLLLSHGVSSMVLFAIMMALGGAALPIYSQSISHVNDHLTPRQFVAASGTLLLLNAAGAATGPILASIFISLFGISGFAALIALCFVSLAVFGVYRAFRKASVPIADRGDTIIMPARGYGGDIYAEDNVISK